MAIYIYIYILYIICVVFQAVVPKPEYADKLLKSEREREREMKSLSLGGCLAELMPKSLTTAQL